MLGIHDIFRYGKHLLLPEIGREGQLALKNAKVLVIGAGGLGCPILQYLSAAGVGCIGIVDFDVIELQNLHRQILYSETEIGKIKVIEAEKTLKKLNPHVQYNVHNQKITDSNVNEIVRHYDVIVDGSDNFATRYLVNDTCVLLGKTLVYGSILKFEGQISVFNYNGSKNLRDLFPQPPNSEDVPDCSLNGVISTLPGIIGTIMAHETLKLIIGLPVLKDELILFNTLNWNFTKLKF